MPPPSFNPRQILYKQYRLEGMTGKAAALKAGYSYSVAMSKKTKIPGLKEEFEMQGLTDRQLVKGVIEGTKATKSDGETADYYARHKYLETAAKLTGHLTEKTQTNVEKMQVNVYLPAPLNAIDNK